MSETIVTWVGLKNGDGNREAANLVKLNPNHCKLIALEKLLNMSCFNLIIVGHDDDIYKLSTAQRSYFRTITSWVVLAGCSTGVGVYNGTLNSGNRSPDGQSLANLLGIKVSATNRALHFDEVGKSLAFARSGILPILIPTNYNAFGLQQNIWVEFKKQDVMSFITEKVSLL